jgi:hypothetical protein
VRWSLFGAGAFSPTACWDWKNALVRVVPGLFPPDLVVQVKALACELPAKYGLPLSRCETKNGIAPFNRLVEQVMTRPPYNGARRVFWIVDNCSAHRGARAAERLRNLYPRLTLVHAPVHASWLNQIEIYFSIIQRKILTPNGRLSGPTSKGSAQRWPKVWRNWSVRWPRQSQSGMCSICLC